MHRNDGKNGEEDEINELFSNVETTVVEVPVKRKPFYKQLRVYLWLLVAALLTVIGYFAFNGNEEDVVAGAVLRTEVFEEPWAVSSYGYPTVTIETPELMEVSSVQLPKNAYTVMGDFTRYTYGNFGDELFVAVGVTKFFEELDEVDLDAGVDIALEELATRYGVKFTNIKKESDSNNGNSGRKVTANFRYEKDRNTMKLLFYANNEGYRQVFVSNSLNNEKASHKSDRVINTIKMN